MRTKILKTQADKNGTGLCAKQNLDNTTFQGSVFSCSILLRFD